MVNSTVTILAVLVMALFILDSPGRQAEASISLTDQLGTLLVEDIVVFDTDTINDVKALSHFGGTFASAVHVICVNNGPSDPVSIQWECPESFDILEIYLNDNLVESLPGPHLPGDPGSYDAEPTASPGTLQSKGFSNAGVDDEVTCEF